MHTLDINKSWFFGSLFARTFCYFWTALIGTVWIVWCSLFVFHYSYNTFGNPTFLWSHFNLHFLPFQTQAYHNVSVMPPVEKTMPGMAMLLGAVGIGMCGYSSRQLALHHRPSARVLQLIGSHTDASMVGTPAHKTPFLDVNRRAGGCQEVPPPSFVGQKFPWNNLWC